ncbi:MAG: bifunctional riboflavin kinase/FAD synthetase [Deltaproteobacteria bacterium]|nr:bifunctional riboflavin kinase/FAD synthetase [Deltaproteobacteria bacterium]MCB9788075.1 bifunctional riboflavin kinase/FAD synthetase [Deltaproteobacteria bacterium]
MQIFRETAELPQPPLEPVATLGNFDGVHRGHQAILARVREEAARREAPSMVITFDPHPRTLLRPEQPHRPIMSLEARLKRLGDLGIDSALVLHFDAAMAEMTAEEFIEEVLWEALHVRAMYVGPYTAFGRARGGDVRLLASVGRRLGYDVGEVEPVFIGGERVSSSRVRRAIAEGDLAGAAQLLGRQHVVGGTVVPGDGRGRTIGVPTANLRGDGGMLPPNGVYAAWAMLPEGREPAVVNVGVRPTFGESGPVTVEAHLIGYSGDLYGRELNLAMVQNLRGEARFPDVAALVRQIKQDIRAAKRVLGVG